MTIAAMPVPMEEASRFGIVITDEDGRIKEFEEKPEKPRVIWHLWEFIYSAGRF